MPARAGSPSKGWPRPRWPRKSPPTAYRVLARSSKSPLPGWMLPGSDNTRYRTPGAESHRGSRPSRDQSVRTPRSPRPCHSNKPIGGRPSINGGNSSPRPGTPTRTLAPQFSTRDQARVSRNNPAGSSQVARRLVGNHSPGRGFPVANLRVGPRFPHRLQPQGPANHSQGQAHLRVGRHQRHPVRSRCHNRSPCRSHNRSLHRGRRGCRMGPSLARVPTRWWNRSNSRRRPESTPRCKDACQTVGR